MPGIRAIPNNNWTNLPPFSVAFEIGQIRSRSGREETSAEFREACLEQNRCFLAPHPVRESSGRWAYFRCEQCGKIEQLPRSSYPTDPQRYHSHASDGRPARWTIECSCGWQRRSSTYRNAVRQAATHCPRHQDTVMITRDE